MIGNAHVEPTESQMTIEANGCVPEGADFVFRLANGSDLRLPMIDAYSIAPLTS